MDIAYLVQAYGYFAVALGCFLEGEAVLLAGSFAAYHGHLALPIVMAIAAVASFLGDVPYFFAGRRYGLRAMRRFPSLRSRRKRLQTLMHRHHVVLLLSLRFLYGMRIAGLLALGMSRMPAWRFLALDFAGALLWSGIVCVAGYGAGNIFNRLTGGEMTPGQITLFAGVLASTILLWIVFRRATAGALGSERNK
ncbi:MAG TPA: DedA family protein [Noviherbaspirillum sp.]|nr:DedA family protein [Noviherbaspirillum sp.]